MAEQRRIELTSEWLCVGGRSVAPTVPTLGMRGRGAEGQPQNNILSRACAGPEKIIGTARLGAANRGRLQISTCTRLAFGG
jgi:hypothetical protein